MTEPSDVVGRADALLKKRRSFVATPGVRPPGPARTAPAADDDDLPVLTEVVSADAAVSEARTERSDDTQVTLLAAEIAHAFGQQLADNLPALLEAALLNAGEELRAGLTATMESALRDFIARRKQLPLPLDEPPADEASGVPRPVA